jgi:hypothetical protein
VKRVLRASFRLFRYIVFSMATSSDRYIRQIQFTN